MTLTAMRWTRSFDPTADIVEIRALHAIGGDDAVFEAITGIKGAFSTRILYVLNCITAVLECTHAPGHWLVHHEPFRTIFDHSD